MPLTQSFTKCRSSLLSCLQERLALGTIKCTELNCKLSKNINHFLYSTRYLKEVFFFLSDVEGYDACTF